MACQQTSTASLPEPTPIRQDRPTADPSWRQACSPEMNDWADALVAAAPPVPLAVLAIFRDLAVRANTAAVAERSAA